MIRGLIHRAGSNVAFLIIAVFATAVAGVGPSYYDSARTSILHDTFAGALTVQRGVEVTQQGGVADRITTFQGEVDADIAATMPDAAQRERVFAPAIQAEEAIAAITTTAAPPLVWRTDYCAHLQLRSGRCSTTAGEVVVSDSLAASQGLRLGQQLRPPGWPRLTVTGFYVAPDVTADYWFGRGGTYFPVEHPKSGARDDTAFDAMFTPRATVDAGTGDPQGSVVVDQLIDGARVQPGDLDRLAAALTELPLQLASAEDTSTASVVTSVPGVAADVHASWRSLAIPIVLIVIQVLLLVWLLMFFVVRDGVDARGGEIALARLRGRRGPRLLGFALSEPLVLLVAAVPLGALLGPVGATVLTHRLLRPGTPVGLPSLTWVAVAVATAGGLAAVLVAGSRTIRRSVVDQWQTTARDADRRGWVFDGVVATAAVAAVVELEAGGHIDSVRSGSLGFLVPGLVGVVGAVVVSRLVPLACRASFRLTGRHGGLAMFLAVRQLARRAISVRAVFVLAVAFALAGFAVIAWSSGRADRRFVGQVGVGAPVVLSVRTDGSVDVGSVVDRLDPTGKRAAVVDSSPNITVNGQILLAVDPARFAAVAAWRSQFAARPLSTLMRQLSPAVAAPLELSGAQVRVRVRAAGVPATGVELAADIESRSGDGAAYTPLGRLRAVKGTQTVTAMLGECPCRLRDLTVSPVVQAQASSDHIDRLQLSVQGIDLRSTGGWHPIGAAQRVAQWRTPGTDASVGSSAGALVWRFPLKSDSTADLVVADTPRRLPVVVTPNADGVHGLGAFSTAGLGGDPLPVQPVATTVSIPGASEGGLIIDRAYAERAADGLLGSFVTQQVWTTTGAAPALEDGLRRAHVAVTDIQTAGAQIRLYDRQGPGLASVAFLAAAGAAAVLGVAGALMGLVSTARRRRFEFAALGVAGASRRTLFSGLLVEQAIVVVTGAGAGAVAGIVAADLAVGHLPQFVTPPVGVPIPHEVNLGDLGIFLAVAAAVLVVSLVLAVRLVVAGVRPDELRGGQP